MTTTQTFDVARYLDDETTIAEYLAVCLEDPDPDLLDEIFSRFCIGK